MRLKPRLSFQNSIPVLWCIVAIVSAITKAAPHRHNNYTIFRSSFYHFSRHQSLYSAYPAEHHDVFLYGPVFSILFAPFALLPSFIGMLLWLCFSVAGCLWAVSQLPMSEKKKAAILWIAFLDLYTALCMQQFNILIGACILLSFAFVEKKKEWAATLFIVLGTLTKLYGIVGLAFFPLLFGGGSYAIEQYMNWFASLGTKNGENLFSLYQNVSLLGMVRKMTGIAGYSDLLLLVPGLILFALPFLRFSQYKAPLFRMSILASTLLFTVLFSTGSESSTYIIALLGVGIWFIHRPKGKPDRLDITLLVGTLFLSSLSPTDLFPAALRKNVVLPYALKALFPTLVWIRLSIELLCTHYLSTQADTSSSLAYDQN